MTKTLKLTKDWGRHKSGAVLTVLGAGDPITPTSVDSARAATLLAGKFAVEAATRAAAPEQTRPWPSASASPPTTASTATPQEVPRG